MCCGLSSELATPGGSYSLGVATESLVFCAGAIAVDKDGKVVWGNSLAIMASPRTRADGTPTGPFSSAARKSAGDTPSDSASATYSARDAKMSRIHLFTTRRARWP